MARASRFVAKKRPARGTEAAGRRGCTRAPWNKGKQHSKTSKQHVFVPRDQLDLFFAVALCFAGPVYCAVLWIALVTSRRISETLLLRTSDLRLLGGEDHDEPHVLFQQRAEDKAYKGNGKLGAERVVARLSTEAIEGMQKLRSEGLEWGVLPVLEACRQSHEAVFKLKPLRKTTFTIPETGGNNFLFPAITKRKGCRPNMSRQTVSSALSRIREVMHKLTNSRRWNPSARCQGNRVTVHGATRHTSAALLLFKKGASPAERPCEHVILEIQQRSDARVFRKHYCHADEDEVRAALEFGAAPSPFGKRKADEMNNKNGVAAPPDLNIGPGVVVPPSPKGGCLAAPPPTSQEHPSGPSPSQRSAPLPPARLQEPAAQPQDGAATLPPSALSQPSTGKHQYCSRNAGSSAVDYVACHAM